MARPRIPAILLLFALAQSGCGGGSVKNTAPDVVTTGPELLVSPGSIQASITGGDVGAAQAGGACILGMPAVETLKEVDPRGTIRKTRQRQRIWLAQTPQVFKLPDILNAHIDARKAAYHNKR